MNFTPQTPQDNLPHRLLCVYHRIMTGVLMLGMSLIAHTAPATSPALEPNKNSELLTAGKAAIESHNYTLAKTQLTEFLSSSPEHAEALHYLGIAKHKLQDNEAAIELLQKATELAPDFTEAHYALGVVYLARAGEVSVLKVRKQLTSSIEHLEKVVALDSQHALAQYYLTQVLLNAPQLMGGDETRGKEVQAQLAISDPFLHQIAEARAAMKKEEWQSAETLLLAALEQQPKHSTVTYSLAELYLQTEDYDKSVIYGEKFIDIPKDWDETNNLAGFYLLAKAHQAQDNKAKSKTYYQLAIENTNNKKFVRSLKKEMAELDKS